MAPTVTLFVSCYIKLQCFLNFTCMLRIFTKFRRDGVEIDTVKYFVPIPTILSPSPPPLSPSPPRPCRHCPFFRPVPVKVPNYFHTNPTKQTHIQINCIFSYIRDSCRPTLGLTQADIVGAARWWKPHDPTVINYDLIPQCDGQTDG